MKRACSRTSRLREAYSPPAASARWRELAVLLAEALDHPHAGDRLVDHAGHLAGALLRVPRGREDRAAHLHAR